MSGSICDGNPAMYRAVKFCPFCGDKRRFVIRSYLYYSTDFGCLNCGSHFNSEEYRRTSEAQRRKNKISY